MNTYPTPQYQQFHIEGIVHVSPYDTFAALLEAEIMLLDVRDENEVSQEKFGNYPSILYHPIGVIMARLDKIPRDKPIVVACTQGIRSTKVANLLSRQGFKHTANLDGGIAAWKEQGMPVIRGTRTYSAGMGCNGNCGGCSGTC
ncbi:MAG: rhodanese-like domain-containing protein [Bacteroidia bacterium]|nr:rhodanese-like domain-containing protein [Bacteroidia bacterium]